MADYKKMYYHLFNKITDMIGDLQEVQKQAEELYLEQNDDTVIPELPSRADTN